MTPVEKALDALIWATGHQDMTKEKAPLVHEAIDALRAQPQAGGWMPIETAPRDGTRIIINESNTMFHPFAEVRWKQNKNYKMGWVGYDCEGEFTAKDPTHWQPIPNPPAQGV